jgi:restriction endonuclease S subunit
MNKRGATIKGITRDCLEQIRLNIPPLPEQKTIAHILSTVRRAIEAQERIIQTTTELKKALMHKLFTEGLRNEPQKQTEIGLVPETWEVVELETTGEVVYGIQAAVANNVAAVGTPILTNKNITLDGGFDFEKRKQTLAGNPRRLEAAIRYGAASHVKHPVDTFGCRFAMKAIDCGPPVSIIRSSSLWQDMRTHSAALW